MIQKTISINAVIRKVIKDLGIDDKEVFIDDFIEWIGEGLQYIGSYYQYIEKETTIDIIDYKGELPCDLVTLLRIHNKSDNLSDSFNKSLIGTNSATNNQISRNSNTMRDYNITNNVVTASYKTGKMYVQYLAFPLDCDGFPEIPDVVDYKDALMWKCAYQLSLRGYTFKSPQLNNYQYVEDKWKRYCIQARAAINMPDADTMERIKNIMIRLKPDLNQYYNNFNSLGKQEFQRARGNNRITIF